MGENSTLKEQAFDHFGIVSIFLDEIEASTLSGNDTDDVFIYTQAIHPAAELPNIGYARSPSNAGGDQSWVLSGGPNRIPHSPHPQGYQIISFLQSTWANTYTNVDVQLMRARSFPLGDEPLGTMRIQFSFGLFCGKGMLLTGWDNMAHHDASLLPSPWGGPYLVNCFGNGCNYTMTLRLVTNLDTFPPPGCREFQHHIDARGIKVGWKWPEKKDSGNVGRQ